MVHWGKKTLPYIALALTVGFALWVRGNTFWLPHWQGDQSQYVTLAMKIAKHGLNDYNLRHVEVRTLSMKGLESYRMIHPRLNIEMEKGDIITGYEKYGLDFYDMPLFYKAPFFPNLLAMSHQWFTRGNHPFLVVQSNLREKVWTFKPYRFFEAQAWAVWIPLAASVLTIILTFFFGKMLFGIRAGVYSALLMATHPIDILVSNRLWTEGLLTFLMTLSMLVFFKSYHKKDYIGIALAGIACGLAILTKQTGGLLLLSVGLYTILCDERKLLGYQTWPKIILNPSILAFVAACFLISAHWFWRVYATYGTPIYEPNVGDLDTFDPGGWHSVVLTSRPAPWLLFLVGIPFICPFFGAVFFTLKKFVRQLKASLTKSGEHRQVLLLWLWIIPTVLYFVILREHSKEHRYLLPVYPAFAMLAAHVIDHVRAALRKVIPKWGISDVIVIGLIVVSALRSVPMALDTILDERNLIFEPF